MQEEIGVYLRKGRSDEDRINAVLEEWAIYLRKSREDRDKEKRGEGDTLKRHREILTAYAARAGLYVSKIYEEVVSGETIKDRPQIQQLISDCYAGKYRGIIVVEVTRLSRGNQGDAQVIMDCLKYSNNNKGLLVHTPTKIYDVLHSHEDEEFMEFELFMSRREFKMINRRLDRGRKQAVVEGNFMGSYRPYGYEIVKTRTSRTLVPNQEEAPIVKMIFEWAVKENMTPGAIARRLTKMGVPTYAGDPDWSASTVKTILTNPTYIGKVRWNDRMQVKTMADGELKVSRPRSNHTDHYMEYDGKHKAHALVDEETFRAASSRFGSDKTKADFTLKNPLAGILVCKNCGKVFVHHAHFKKADPRFRHKTSDYCKVKSVKAGDLMDALIHVLKNYIEDFELKITELPDVDTGEIERQIEAMHKEIRKIEKVMDRLWEAWEAGNITDNEFVKRKTVNNQKMENIKAEIERLENTVPDKEDFQEIVTTLHKVLDTLVDGTISAETKNIYLKEIIEKIEFSRENNEEFILDVFLR